MNKITKFCTYVGVGIYLLLLAYSFVVAGFVKTLPLIFAGSQIVVVFALYKGQKMLIEIKKHETTTILKG